MGRGLLSGLIWGAILSGLGLAVASRVAPVVELAMPPVAGEVEVSEDSEFARSRADADPVIPEAEAPPPGGEAPAAPEAAPDAAPRADTDPADVPETGAPEAEALDAPEVATDPDAGAAAPPAEGVLDDPVARETGEAPPAPEVELEPEAPEAPSAEAAAGVTLFEGVGEIAVPTPDSSDPAGGVSVAEPPAGPALEVNAIPFDWDGSAPLLSVLLIDRGGPLPEIDRFPVPVTVAVDPLDPAVPERVAALRAAGAEIAVLAPLAEGATPADVEVAFQSFLEAVPFAATVLDIEEARIQESRPRAAQVAEILAETGHGLVTYEAGLNSALQVAAQRGVPAATVLRAFDDGTRGVGAMRRFLDQAAFQAGVDGYAIVTGELRPDALTALAEWALGTRAESVTLAPVSGILDSAP
jgi:polysaccharide deacetylase 2 family uncharacterized protein YibQ